MEKCKKCLLLEAGERVTYEELMQYVATLSSDVLVNEETYQKRILYCKECDSLIAGMCLKCGCYVEIRARLRNADCPDYNHRRWSSYETV